MKAILKTSLIAVLGILLLSGFSLREQPEDPPRGAKKKHLKMVKVENGEKTVVDTIITDDTDAFTWFSDSDFSSEIDSAIQKKLKKVRVKIDDEGGKQNVFVFSDGDDILTLHDFDITTETITDGDSIVKVIVMKNGDGKIKEKIVHLDHDKHFVHIPKPPYPPMPQLKFLKHADDKMVIDLSDPGILSFKKKDLSGGREKIEIIRKKPIEEEIEVEVQVDEEDENN